MLFKREFHQGLIDGSITLTFRRWTRPQVKVGGRYRFGGDHAIEVDAVTTVTPLRIRRADASRSGFSDRAALLALLDEQRGTGKDVYRVEFHYAGKAGPGPPAADARLSSEDVEALAARLEKMDRLSAHGAWTRRTLTLIDRHPHTVSTELARKLGRETRSFKADVRKLKRLGLTLSHEVGYEISLRGRAFLRARGRAR